jgi:hypothetical protein
MAGQNAKIDENYGHTMLAVTDDLAAENVAQGLHSQTNPQNWHFSGKMFNYFTGNTRIFRFARTGRDNQALGFKGFDLFYGNFIVAVNPDVLTQLPEILDEVVSKRIVVIDH